MEAWAKSQAAPRSALGEAAMLGLSALAVKGVPALVSSEWLKRPLTDAAYKQLQTTGKVTPAFTNKWPTGYRPLKSFTWNTPGGLQTGPTKPAAAALTTTAGILINHFLKKKKKKHD